ncbi:MULTISPECIES: hypothetical protein [Priestia]|uniref:hypothetical protein n=1 Tax=Priestia TaxID=2800373 RepID=UPI0020409CDE|nr:MULTISPECIES: hypothetical protein [Priestia]MCM3772316.1 hypothetical protein [Priestia aryabhattai]MDY0940599.1 hypothetical protein [Priestia megaterium]
MYFLKSLSNEVKSAQLYFNRLSKTKQLVLGALFASLAALFQSTGGLLPGIGIFISPLSTAPILFCFIISLPLGFITYILTNLLLLIIQPSELIIFPFTTGILGIGIGVAFYFFKKRLYIIISGATLLTLGIITLLYVFKFPVLGLMISKDFSLSTTGFILLFTFLYSWVWVELSLAYFKKLKTFISL